MTFWFNNVNYEGFVFTDFEVRNNCWDGPGWYVVGFNAEKYGTDDAGKGRYVKTCAGPDVERRKPRNWNVQVRRGWRTKREAQEVASWLNRAAV